MDETSFQRRHEYVTVVNDLTTSEPCVLYVVEGRAGAALDGHFDAVGEAGCAWIRMVAMAIWPCYITSVGDHAAALIAFDRFHVAQHLGAAVDPVRRSENRALREHGDDRLVKTRSAAPGIHCAGSLRVARAWRSRNWRRG